MWLKHATNPINNFKNGQAGLKVTKPATQVNKSYDIT